MSYARIFTGFNTQLGRSNLETRKGNGSPNYIDPMRIITDWRDVFPKMDLYDGYVGDGLPLCADLPNRAFLRVGATWRYLGRSSLSQLQSDPSYYDDAWALAEPHLAPAASTSALHRALCRPAASAAGGHCRFPSELTLSANLPCDGLECAIDEPRVARIVEPSSGEVRAARVVALT